MPLTLLFSNTVQTQEPVIFPADIISARSLVIDVINVQGVLRRQAGWIYSVVGSPPNDDEIADSHTIMYGKNRCNFTTHPLPYRLMFFPVWGTKKYDLNVYSGDSGLPVGTQLNPSFVARLNKGIRHGMIEYRLTNSSTWVLLPGVGAIAEAYYRPGTNALIVRTLMNEITFCIVGTWTWVGTDLPTLRTVVAETATRALITA